MEDGGCRPRRGAAKTLRPWSRMYHAPIPSKEGDPISVHSNSRHRGRLFDDHPDAKRYTARGGQWGVAQCGSQAGLEMDRERCAHTTGDLTVSDSEILETALEMLMKSSRVCQARDVTETIASRRDSRLWTAPCALFCRPRTNRRARDPAGGGGGMCLVSGRRDGDLSRAGWSDAAGPSGRREPGETQATFPRAAGRRKDAQGGGRKATARGGRSVNAGDASCGMARSIGGGARQVEDARESSRRARLEKADGADACGRQEERRRRERRETQAGEALKSACAAASHALALLLTPSQSGLAPVRDAPPRRPATASLRRYSGRPL